MTLQCGDPSSICWMLNPWVTTAYSFKMLRVWENTDLGVINPLAIINPFPTLYRSPISSGIRIGKINKNLQKHIHPGDVCRWCRGHLQAFTPGDAQFALQLSDVVHTMCILHIGTIPWSGVILGPMSIRQFTLLLPQRYSLSMANLKCGWSRGNLKASKPRVSDLSSQPTD